MFLGFSLINVKCSHQRTFLRLPIYLIVTLFIPFSIKIQIFKSTDDIFGSNVPPPIPKKDTTPITSPTSNDVFNFQPVLPPKIPEKPPKKTSDNNKPQKPPLKPPLPSKPKFEF